MLQPRVILRIKVFLCSCRLHQQRISNVSFMRKVSWQLSGRRDFIPYLSAISYLIILLLISLANRLMNITSWRKVLLQKIIIMIVICCRSWMGYCLRQMLLHPSNTVIGNSSWYFILMVLTLITRSAIPVISLSLNLTVRAKRSQRTGVTCWMHTIIPSGIPIISCMVS